MPIWHCEEKTEVQEVESKENLIERENEERQRKYFWELKHKQMIEEEQAEDKATFNFDSVMTLGFFTENTPIIRTEVDTSEVGTETEIQKIHKIKSYRYKITKKKRSHIHPVD